jgi:dihydroxyacetone kinase
LPRPSADELAEILVDKILGDLPVGIAPKGARAALILSGLGSVKYEELFVLYRMVNQILTAAGVEISEPEVGELVTSFDMAGVSLTLCWLDDQLEEAWLAPASTPAYRKGVVATSSQDLQQVFDPTQTITVLNKGTGVSVEQSKKLLLVFEAIKQVIDDQAEELGRLDAIAGDGDHGIGMQRGVIAACEAVYSAAEAGAGAAATLNAAADAWSDYAGGTSGVIWGVILSSIASELDNQNVISAQQVASGLQKALENVQNFGKAQLGDKTLIDTLEPFTRSVATSVAAGKNLLESWSVGSLVAMDAAEKTKELLPKIGRARPHAEKSLGVLDPGALSMAMIIEAVKGTWAS